MEAANRYLAEVYLPAFNAEFMQPAAEEGTAFLKWIGANFDDILCEQHESTYGGLTTVSALRGKRCKSLLTGIDAIT